MVNGAAGAAVVMAREVTAMTGATLSATGNSRGLQAAVGGGVMAGDTTLGIMNLSHSDIRRTDRAMAVGTIGGVRVGDGVFLHLGAVVMAMGVKIGSVTLSTGTAVAAVDGGVTIGAGNARTVDVRVAQVAAVVMNRADDGAGVTVHAQGGAGDGQAVIMAVQCGKEGGTVTADALRIRGDGHDQRTGGWILEGRRRGMTVAPLIGVNNHGGVAWMTPYAE